MCQLRSRVLNTSIKFFVNKITNLDLTLHFQMSYLRCDNSHLALSERTDKPSLDKATQDDIPDGGVQMIKLPSSGSITIIHHLSALLNL